uniref:Uncharacterized protein LOC113795649 n=1 Tax=Dermatophagoides pteronyssinus TaxID=6956 RepID=A0A6P6Y9M9_DERPT
MSSLESTTTNSIVNNNNNNNNIELENSKKIEIKLREKRQQQQQQNSPVESIRPLGIIIDTDLNLNEEDNNIEQQQQQQQKPNIEAYQSSDSICEQQPQQEDYNIDPALYFHNRNPTLESFRNGNGDNDNKKINKSDSLDSQQQQQQACCTKLAFNFYNKALDSAKKHLPNRNRQKNRYSGGFPRSFGEDFHSLGPDGFYYLDNDQQTECSLDYRDLEFNRDSFLSFTGSEVIPELSEEEFFENKIQRKSLNQQQNPTNIDCTVRNFQQLPTVQGGEQTLAPIIGIMDENEPMSSTTTDQSIIKQRKGPSLFDRLFRRKDDNKNKKSRKARSESRERERRTKNIRATSLPPSTTNIGGGKHQLQQQHPVMKLGPDGQLWFEQQDGTQIISTTSTAAIDPNEAILSNVTRQSPIKLVYARPPEIIVQEVTNLTDTIDTLPRIQSPNVSSKPNQEQISTDHRTPSPPNTVDEVAEKTMLDILDDAIRQLRDESSNQMISPIYVNENIQPESSPTDQNKLGKQDKKSTKSTSPKFGRKKRKLPGYSSSPMAKFKDIRMTKPKFFRKFHSKNPKKMKETSQPTVELKDSKRNSDVDPTQVVAEANVPEITIDEVTPSSSNIQDDDDMNNVEIVDIEQKVEEPQPPPFLLSSNDKPKKKLVRKSKINLKSVRIPRSFRKISKKDDNHDDDGFSKKISPPKSPQPSTTDLKEKLKNPFNRQNKQQQQKQKHHFIRQLPRLPDIPESRNSTLNSQQHLYEGIKGSPQLNQRPYHNNSLEIEFPVGIPLDQPYEEFDDNNNEPGLSPFHRYPDQQQQDDNRNKESPIILQSELPVNNLSKLPVTEITLAKLPDSPVFDMKIPKEICERFPSSYHNQPPEILVKIPENHKFKTESLDKQSVNSDHQKQQSEFSFSNSNVPDIVMMEPEFILSKRPGIEIHHHDHSPLSSDMPSILTMEIKSDDNLEPSPSSSIYVPYNPPTSTTFDSNIESNRSTTRHQMAALNDAMHEKVDKIKNMAGSFRLKMKDFIHHTKTPSSKTDPKIIDQTLKPEFKFQETDLDQPTTATTDFDASMKIEQNQQQQQEKEKEIPMDYEDPSKIIEALDNLLSESGYRLDNDDNNMEKRSKKSFKKKFPKFEFTHKPRTIEQQQWTDNVNNNHYDDNDDNNDIERPTSFARKNRERFDQIRNRAQKSFGQFADRVKQQTQQIGERTRASITRAKTKSPLRKRPDRPPPPTSSFYDLHFASDSELSPGTGIDSLRRSTTTKVYQDLADQQERLEVYMQPVNRNQPRRPPRRHLNYDDDERRQQQHPDYMQSLPSLSVTKPKPPRPPPPNRYLTTSCQSMIPCDEEISLGTSTSSLLSSPQDKHRRRRRFPRRQRCPPEQFYKNVRLNYRPKKSYVELLQKSQPFYTMAIQQKSLERSQSTGQLYGRYKPKPIDNFGYPIPPLRRSRTLRSKPPICPPSRTIFDNSRAASVFSARSGGHGQNYSVPRDYLFINDQYRDNNNDDDQYLLKGKDFYSPYLQAPPITLNVGSQPDLQWSPFQWKVKRCRSFGETMDKQKLQSPELEETSSTTQTPDSNDTIVPSKSTTLKRSATTIVANQNYRIDNTTHRIIQPETVQQRMFKWLQSTSTTSLDTLRHRIPKNLNIIKQQQFDSDNKGLIRSRSNSKGRRQTPPPRPPPSSKMIMMMMMNRATSPSSSLSTTTTNQSISCYSTNNDYTNNNYYNYNNIDNFLADTFGDDIIGSTNNTLNGGDHLHKNHLPLSSSNRPLPPPPIPPRPKLIPAHYLYDVQRKQQQQRPLTRDVACDTSENGFEKFCQKNNNHGFLNNNRQQIEKLRRNDKDPDDDDITLVENNSSHRFYLHNQNGHHIPNGSINLDTIASVYTDARTHQSNNTLNSNHQNQNQKSSSIKQWFDDNNVSESS